MRLHRTHLFAAALAAAVCTVPPAYAAAASTELIPAVSETHRPDQKPTPTADTVNSTSPARTTGARDQRAAPERPETLGAHRKAQLPQSADGPAPLKAAAAWVNITSDFAGRSHTNQCLDVDVTGNGANGSKIQVWECNGSSQQLWYWWDDYFLESARYPGKCIDADLNGGGANGTRLQLWDCNGSTQQQFFRYSNDLAIYNARFYNNGNTVVDRNATVPGNGAGVQLWQKNYQSQQWWSVR